MQGWTAWRQLYLCRMSERTRPQMEPYSRHVLVCTGDFCSPGRGGRQIYSLLAELLQREDLLFGPQRVKRGETPCLGVCSDGPIVVVYPEGVWYSRVFFFLLERPPLDPPLFPNPALSH